MRQNKAIDMWAPLLPVPEIMDYVADNFPEQMLGYVRVFWKMEPTLEMVRERARNFKMSEEEVIQAIDQAQIERSLITGFDEKTSAGKTLMTNEIIAGLSKRHPDRFIPFAGVDIFKGKAGVHELHHWITKENFKGLSLRPFMIGLPADDRKYYPFYEKCVELDIPLSIHSSANWTTVAVNDLGHPRHIDPIARDFPDLKIIMSHAGYPWVLESVLLAWKYPNVYLELAAHRPRYLTEPGTGWEPLLRFGQTTIQDKILFGTGWFLLGRSPGEITEEFRALAIRAEIMEKWLYGNAARLLGLKT